MKVEVELDLVTQRPEDHEDLTQLEDVLYIEQVGEDLLPARQGNVAIIADQVGDLDCPDGTEDRHPVRRLQADGTP